ILMPMTAYSPSAPRKPVSGVRWPTRILSGWAPTQEGSARPASPAAAAVRRTCRREGEREGSCCRLIACLLLLGAGYGNRWREGKILFSDTGNKFTLSPALRTG